MDQNRQKNSRKMKGGLTGIGIAVVILLAVVLIKVLPGGGLLPGSDTPVPDVFDIYKIEIPEFDGTNYYREINGGQPFFAPDDMKDSYFAELSELDSLNRAGSAIMCADEAHIQTGERSNISDMKPSGWHGGGFYQRSHLLMWKLSGINTIENLVTGTATFNGDNMQDFEKKVTRYLWDHPGNHVMYRVSPLFLDKELVCRGVLMEAYSVEDEGALSFCVFVYNAEPGALIDYETGDYMEDAENLTTERAEEQ